MGMLLIRKRPALAYNTKPVPKPKRGEDGRCYYCRHDEPQVCGARWVRGAVCTRPVGHAGDHVFCTTDECGRALWTQRERGK